MSDQRRHRLSWSHDRRAERLAIRHWLRHTQEQHRQLSALIAFFERHSAHRSCCVPRTRLTVERGPKPYHASPPGSFGMERQSRSFSNVCSIIGQTLTSGVVQARSARSGLQVPEACGANAGYAVRAMAAQPGKMTLEQYVAGAGRVAARTAQSLSAGAVPDLSSACRYAGKDCGCVQQQGGEVRWLRVCLRGAWRFCNSQLRVSDPR
jgi:hypothetical protein